MANVRRVLLTGDRGMVGSRLKKPLRRSGYSVEGFDLRAGQDIRDLATVVAAAQAADVIVHAATLPAEFAGPEAEMFAVNVAGTANVLRAAEAAGHERVVVFSSSQVFGLPGDPGFPAGLPIRDSHPRLAANPYGRSKVAVEDICAEFSERTGIATICLRPVHVWVPGQAADRARRWRKDPSLEWRGPWGLGGFVDIRDVASAVVAALGVPTRGHHRLLLSAPDIAATAPALEAAARFYPGVAIDSEWFARCASAPMYDASEARSTLGWEAVHSWANGSRESWPARVMRRLRDF
jgi:nucleoside-diphosphate-sugar epimerase